MTDFERLYKTKRYSRKQGDVVPKYILTENAQGSVADIKARGVWKDGKWTPSTCSPLNQARSARGDLQDVPVRAVVTTHGELNGETVFHLVAIDVLLGCIDGSQELETPRASRPRGTPLQGHH